MIDPRVVSGTRDILPPLAIERGRIVRQLQQTFERYGFAPIDTPVLERREVLYAKGGDEVQRQVFEVAARGQAIEESELALRFDLTVPLARFMARHVDALGVPFKRYHIGLVYRGERAQRGRYREFYQCDFDTIGTRSSFADAEIALVICDGLRAIGVPDFTLRLNHRQILDGMLESLGLVQHSEHVLRALDKLPKIGREGVLDELQFGETAAVRPPEAPPPSSETLEGIGERSSATSRRILQPQEATRILDFIESTGIGSPDQVLALLSRDLGANSRAREGLVNLRTVCELLVAGGVSAEQILLQIGLARGLDYYTGIIFETMITGQEAYGSVCSGGRYDDLAGLFTTRQLPGVGASFGLDRLSQLLADAGRLGKRSTVASVLIVNFQESDWAHYVRAGTELRSAGIAAEIYAEPKPMREQLGYASTRGHRLAVIIGPDEIQTSSFALRDLATRQQERGVPRVELASRVEAALRVAAVTPQ